MLTFNQAALSRGGRAVLQSNRWVAQSDQIAHSENLVQGIPQVPDAGGPERKGRWISGMAISTNFTQSPKGSLGCGETTKRQVALAVGSTKDLLRPPDEQSHPLYRTEPPAPHPPARARSGHGLRWSGSSGAAPLRNLSWEAQTIIHEPRRRRLTPSPPLMNLAQSSQIPANSCPNRCVWMQGGSILFQ